MKALHKKYFGFPLCMVTALLLSACGNGEPTGGFPGAKSPEASLPPPVALPADDPLQAHLVARKQVDPSDLSAHHKYTKSEAEAQESKEVAAKADEARVAELESQLAALRKDFKTLGPKISPTSGQGQAAIVQDAPAVSSSIPPPSAVMSSSVTGVRVGEHPDKTRLVFDMNAPGKFSSDMQNDGRRLVVNLPESSWAGEMQKTLPNSQLISAYSVSPSPSGGVIVTIDLKKPAKLSLSDALKPNEVYGHRIVFDVAPL